MAIEHVAITDPQVHEPKGATTAANNTAYFSNGAGSGAWGLVTSARIDAASLAAWINTKITDATILLPKRHWVSAVIADISTASSVLMSVPGNCTIVGAQVTLGGAIATANSTVTFKNAAGASFGGSVVVAFSGSAKGDKYTYTASANQSLVGPTWIEIATDGLSDNVIPLYVTVEFTTTS